MMLPVLNLFSDEQQRPNSAIYRGIADHFALSDDDERQDLPRGGQPTYKNRFNWATTYLFNAGLLNRPQQGICRINASGNTLLETKPDKIEEERIRHYLKAKPQSIAFREEVAATLDKAGIPYDSPFSNGDVICDFLIPGPPRIAIEYKPTESSNLIR